MLLKLLQIVQRRNLVYWLYTNVPVKNLMALLGVISHKNTLLLEELHIIGLLLLELLQMCGLMVLGLSNLADSCTV